MLRVQPTRRGFFVKAAGHGFISTKYNPEHFLYSHCACQLTKRFYQNMKAKLLFTIASLSAVTLLFFCYDETHTQPQQKPPALTVPVKTQRKKPTGERRGTPKAETGAERFQDTEFYRTLIDNNLFRPLGWTPERPQDPYRLLGTLIPTDESAAPQAILQNTATGTTHTLTEGSTLDAATTLRDIQPKQGTLEKAGQLITLTLNTDMWLK